MQRILAIAALTWKAALRFKLFLVLMVMLLVVVVGLPLLIKDDGTARGFTQILLTYTLSVVTAFLGLATLWLSCGTLARDIEECQIQMLDVKPVSRWQIWLGKWLGIVSLNAVLLAVSGACIYGLLFYRAQQLPPEEQQVLRDEVLVARSSAKERSFEDLIQQETDRIVRERLRSEEIRQDEIPLLRQQTREQVKAAFQVVPPGGIRPWEIDLGSVKDKLRDQPLFLRIKFNAAERVPTGTTFIGMWQVGVPETPRLWRSEPMSLAPDTFHEFEVPPNLLDEDGKLYIMFLNPNNTTLLFSLEEGLTVLYREGGFTLNFARGLGIIFCWLALLAAIGLTAATFLSFPVAAFFSLSLLVIVFSSGTLASVVEEGTLMGVNEETGAVGRSILDFVAVPLFNVLLKMIRMVEDFSPIDALSTGRSIGWPVLGRAALQVVVLFGGVIALAGVWLFHRRELATAQGTQ